MLIFLYQGFCWCFEARLAFLSYTFMNVFVSVNSVPLNGISSLLNDDDLKPVDKEVDAQE